MPVAAALAGGAALNLIGADMQASSTRSAARQAAEIKYGFHENHGRNST